MVKHIFTNVGLPAFFVYFHKRINDNFNAGKNLSQFIFQCVGILPISSPDGHTWLFRNEKKSLVYNDKWYNAGLASNYSMG